MELIDISRHAKFFSCLLSWYGCNYRHNSPHSHDTVIVLPWMAPFGVLIANKQVLANTTALIRRGCSCVSAIPPSLVMQLGLKQPLVSLDFAPIRSLVGRWSATRSMRDPHQIKIVLAFIDPVF